MQHIQRVRNPLGVLPPLPNIVYPEGKIQSLEAFQRLLLGLRGSLVVEVEKSHFEWYEIDPEHPDQLCQLFKDRNWEACFDTLHFVHDMPVGFEPLLEAMAGVITHVHIRVDVVNFEQAVSSVRNLLSGTGIETEQLQAVSTKCSDHITHITMEVPWRVLAVAAGCDNSLASMRYAYGLLLQRVRSIFG